MRMRKVARGLLLWLLLLWLLLLPAPGAADAPLTLEDCVARALATIPQMAAADAALDLADAQRREAAASLWPSVRTDVQYLQEPGYREVITNRGLSAAQLIGDYTVYDGGRRLAEVHAAEYAEQARRFGVAAARSEVVFATTVAFYGLERAADQVAALQASVAELTRYLAVVQALRQSGRATASDVLRIDLLLRQSRLQLNAATHGRTEASFALGALIGTYGRGDLTVSAPRNPPEQAGGGSVANNPTLRALEGDRAAAAAALAAAEAERYPTLRMELTSGFLGTDPPSTLSRYAGASYGGVLSVPLFEGGAVRARIDEARARIRQAGAAADAARIDLDERLAAAESRFDEARQALGLLQQTLPVAQGSFALCWARFLGGGTATLLEVADSYGQLLSTRLAILDQQFAARQA